MTNEPSTIHPNPLRPYSSIKPLTEREVDNALLAAAHAAMIGRPLNRMITIHWNEAGVGVEKAGRATARFRDLLGKCCTRHGGKLASVWVLENGIWQGSHAHILAHVPTEAHASMIRLQKRWIKSISGARYQKTCLKGRSIVGAGLAMRTDSPEVYGVNLRDCVEYLLKTTTPDVAGKFTFRRRIAVPGEVMGKRIGTSNNIGRMARHRTRELLATGNDASLNRFLGAYWGRLIIMPSTY